MVGSCIENERQKITNSVIVSLLEGKTEYRKAKKDMDGKPKKDLDMRMVMDHISRETEIMEPSRKSLTRAGTY